jgi:hypothetical protein
VMLRTELLAIDVQDAVVEEVWSAACTRRWATPREGAHNSGSSRRIGCTSHLYALVYLYKLIESCSTWPDQIDQAFVIYLYCISTTKTRAHRTCIFASILKIGCYRDLCAWETKPTECWSVSFFYLEWQNFSCPTPRASCWPWHGTVTPPLNHLNVGRHSPHI